MKFRWHRGGFKKSMETTIELRDTKELEELVVAWAKKHYIRSIGDFYRVDVSPYGGVDSRNGWDTHIVTLDGNAVGFTDGMPETSTN